MAAPKVDARAISVCRAANEHFLRFYQRITRAVFRVRFFQVASKWREGWRKGWKKRGRVVLSPRKQDEERREGYTIRDSVSVVENASFRFCSSPPPPLLTHPLARQREREREPSWMRSTGQKIHDPFSVRAPPPPTQPRNGHEGWWILLPARKRRFSLICPTIKHTTESTLADTFYRRARNDVLLSRERERDRDRERERERDYFILYTSGGGGSPPSGNFMASGFSVCLLLVPLLVSQFLCRKGGRRVYIQSGLFLVALVDDTAGRFKRSSLRYITLIRSLTVFCRGGDVLSRAHRCFGELSGLLTGCVPANVTFCEKWNIPYFGWL